MLFMRDMNQIKEEINRIFFINKISFRALNVELV